MNCSEKISVIIPIYNTEKYIGRCLKSVLSNTYYNLEVICVDDGSTDLSYNILKKYAEKDNRIKVIRQENAGVSAARNAGLDVMTGEYVSFVDSDDWIHPRCFETLLYFLKKTKATVAGCICKNILSEENQFVNFEKEDLQIEVLGNLDKMLNNNEAKRLVCGRLYSSDLVQQNRFETELQYGEDTFFNVSLFSKNPDMIVALIKKDLYFYYQRATSACRTVDWRKKICLPKKYLDYLENNLSINQEIYLLEACKAILAFRYDVSFLPDYKEIELECSRMIVCCKMKLREFNNIKLKNRIVFDVFFAFPFIYRIVRIVLDRTLLDWERVQKEQRKNLHE